MPDSRLRILSFTTVYPRPGEPRFGVFVRARLQALAEFSDIVVVSPTAVIDFGNPNRRLGGAFAPSGLSTDGELRVLRPRWIYPPSIGWMHPWWLAAFTARPIARLRQEFPFNMIDAHFGHPEASAAHRLAARFRVPFTVTLRGNETFHAQDARKRRLMACALRAAARVVGVSEPLREFALSLGVEPDRAITIPNGIDSSVFHPRDRAAERRRLGMDNTEVHILSAGYLIERKGHHRIVEALPSLIAGGRSVRLWIVGDPGSEGDYSAEIRHCVFQCGVQASVSFVPSVEAAELACYMSACDVFCLASSREGWPNVVNEALACGAPVVACNVGGVPAMIPDHRFGFVVESGNRDELASALAAALSRDWDRNAISQHGLSRSWRQVAREVFEQFCAVAVDNRQ